MLERIVLDTDVIIAALRSSRGASSELLKLAVQQKITLLARRLSDNRTVARES